MTRSQIMNRLNRRADLWVSQLNYRPKRIKRKPEDKPVQPIYRDSSPKTFNSSIPASLDTMRQRFNTHVPESKDKKGNLIYKERRVHVSESRTKRYSCPFVNMCAVKSICDRCKSQKCTNRAI